MRHDSHFVEQLFRADELPIGKKIPIHRIEANPDQPRSVLGDLDDLKNSILEKGILEPILVRPKEDGRYTIISGERRFRAAMEAGLGEIPCIEMTVTDAEVMEIALIENLQRRDLTPLEEAEGYQVLQGKHSYTHEAIAKAVGKSRVTITETLALARLPDRVKELCRRADIRSKTLLLEISRLKTEEEMLAALAGDQRESPLRREEVRELKRDVAGRGQENPVKFPAFRKAYELTFRSPEQNYAVSLTLRGHLQEKDQIVNAIRDLLRRIHAGEIDLEASGTFHGTQHDPSSLQSLEASSLKSGKPRRAPQNSE